jgi:hypothetical protein
MPLKNIRTMKLLGGTYGVGQLEALFMQQQGVGNYLHPELRKSIHRARNMPEINKPKPEISRSGETVKGMLT